MIGKKLQKALGLAVEELKRRRHEYLTLEHVLTASHPSLPEGSSSNGAAAVPPCCGRPSIIFFKDLYRRASTSPPKTFTRRLPSSVCWTARWRTSKARDGTRTSVFEVGDVLAAILEEEVILVGCLLPEKAGHHPACRVGVAISHNDEEGQDESSSESGEGEGGAESAKDALARYTVDLTARAREGKLDPLVGREMELSRSIEILARRRKNNPLYVGDPGTGKTAIAEGLALRIVSGNVPPEFKDTKIYSLDRRGRARRGALPRRLRRPHQGRGRSVAEDPRRDPVY